MRESTFTLVYWGFIPSFPTKGQLVVYLFMTFAVWFGKGIIHPDPRPGLEESLQESISSTVGVDPRSDLDGSFFGCFQK